MQFKCYFLILNDLGTFFNDENYDKNSSDLNIKVHFRESRQMTKTNYEIKKTV